ncbi:hypothetical protein [Streptomyces sp. SAS_270]|uniref:hypothetical protein n=1 Tax=Streptomyces sp. SAS_270 TaxID=3412748 RepID=UPI00403C54C3
MPGQRKRKRQQEARSQRARAAYEERDGRWERIFSTQDEAEFRAFKSRFLAEHQSIDPSMVRIDVFCGRLVQPTSYCLSVFVPAESSERADRAGGAVTAVPQWP